MINDSPIDRLRTRQQSNFDVRMLSAYQDDDSLITLAAPERTPTSCERYSPQELRLVHGDSVNSEQLIRDEVAVLADVRLRLRCLRDQRDALYKRHRAALREEWRRLKAKFPRTVVFYKKTYTTAWRNAKWVKIPLGFRTIRRRVHLKARPRWRYRWVVRPDFTRYRELYLDPSFRPYVYRELKIPKYVRRIVRPAGFRRVVVRTKVERQSYDWSRIKPLYVAFKVDAETRLSGELAALDAERQTYVQRIRDRVQQPHRLVACTNTGYIPPSWKEYYYQYFRQVGDYEKVYQHLQLSPHVRIDAHTGSLQWESKVSTTLVPHLMTGVDTVWTNDPVAALESMRKAEIGHEPDPEFTYDIEAPGMLHPKTVTGELILLDKSSDKFDEPLEQLAASTVSSLRKGADYAFHLPRSIGELKDIPETYNQARDFMRWFAGGFRSRRVLGSAEQRAFDTIVRRTGSASLALVGAFLAWRFAIQPTIQDCQTLRDHSKEWIFAARRALRKTISNLRATSTNILHVRSKFTGADYLRELTVAVQNSGLVTVEATIPLRYQLPAPVSYCPEPSSRYEFFTELEKWRPSGHSFLDETEMLDCTLVSAPYRFEGQLNASFTLGGDVEPREFAVSDGRFTVDGLYGHTDCTFPLDEVKEHIRRTVQYPKAEVPAYLQNQVSGVSFARYQIGDLLAFLQNDGLIPDLEALERSWSRLSGWDAAVDAAFNTVYDYASHPSQLSQRTSELLASVDALYVTWQLLPLSFIYDWFTNSESVVSRLNNFATEYYRPPPPSLDGTWVTKRCELLAGRPGLSIYQSKSTTYVSDWYAWRYRDGYRLIHASDPTIQWSVWHYIANPARVSNTLRFDYLPDDKIHLARSGLYVAKRGEHIAGGWETFLPQVQVKLDLSKVGTLLGILVGFIRPRAQA